MSDAPNPRFLINPDGSSFSAEKADLETQLDALSDEKREEFRNANASQIAEHDAKLLLVVAGPGAGKSYLFLDRIRHWLQQYEDPQIYVSSFVRKLVKDLEYEIATRIGKDALQNVDATTLHTLARSIIERNRGGGSLSLRPHVRVISGRWEDMVWADVLAFHPSDAQPRFKELKTQFNADDLLPAQDWIDLRGTYDSLRQLYNAVGFADMITTARLAVEAKPSLVEHSFWIIDEFQDFNTGEERLIQAVIQNAEAVLVAGDDEQALYQALKGSHPEIIVSYYDDPVYANAMLPYCSRCSYYVCRAACGFIEQHRVADAISKIYLPLKKDEEAPKVRMVAAAAPSSAVGYIRAFLKEHGEQLEAHAEEMKAGTETDPFLLILTPEREVGFYKLNGADQKLRDLVAEWSDPATSHSADYWRLVDYFSAANDPLDNFAVRKVLDHEGISTTDAHDVIAKAIDDATTLNAVESEVVSDALKKCDSIAAALRSEMTASEVVDHCAQLMSIADPGRLVDELDADPISDASDEGEDAIETGGGGSPVELLTIVGAKGLSAKHVIVLGCDDVNLAHTTTLGFYVALTRARESLHLIVAAKAGGAKGPHGFLGDLPEDACEFVVHKTSGTETLASFNAFTGRFETWVKVAKRATRR